MSPESSVDRRRRALDELRLRADGESWAPGSALLVGGDLRCIAGFLAALGPDADLEITATPARPAAVPAEVEPRDLVDRVAARAVIAFVADYTLAVDGQPGLRLRLDWQVQEIELLWDAGVLVVSGRCDEARIAALVEHVLELGNGIGAGAVYLRPAARGVDAGDWLLV